MLIIKTEEEKKAGKLENTSDIKKWKLLVYTQHSFNSAYYKHDRA